MEEGEKRRVREVCSRGGLCHDKDQTRVASISVSHLLIFIILLSSYMRHLAWTAPRNDAASNARSARWQATLTTTSCCISTCTWLPHGVLHHLSMDLHSNSSQLASVNMESSRVRIILLLRPDLIGHIETFRRSPGTRICSDIATKLHHLGRRPEWW